MAKSIQFEVGCDKINQFIDAIQVGEANITIAIIFYLDKQLISFVLMSLAESI